jgi:hypothetical protein
VVSLQLLAARAAQNHRSTSPALWTLADLTAPPAVWYDDSSPITGTTACSQWNDVSGNGHHAAQPTTAWQPSVVDDALNGKRVLGFDGTQQYLGLFSDAFGITNKVASVWIFAVYKLAPADTSGVERPIFDWCTGSLQGTRAGLFAALSSAKNKPQCGGRRLDTDSSNWVVADSEHAGQWVMALGCIDYSARTASLYIDGNDPVIASGLWTGSGITSSTNSSNVRIGGNNAGTAVTWMKGQIARVASGIALPSSDEIDKIFGEAAATYGLQDNLPADHPYKDAPP